MGQQLPKIIDHMGTLGKRGQWTIELNYVQWEDREPQFSINRWSPDHKKMGKGITLFDHEFAALCKKCQGIRFVK